MTEGVVDWFEKLTGFREGSYDLTRSRLEVSGNKLRSKVNCRSYTTGFLETPSLGELRQRARDAISDVAGKLQVSCVSGDVRKMHHDVANENALFQVASQFNLLEMTGPGVTPEDGVTRYTDDPTQGPACAIAAGAATIYRNYFAAVEGQSGQTANRQIDCLTDLGIALGNEANVHWTMRNGYALCTKDGLSNIENRLRASSPAQIDALRERLRIGLHWDVQVTDAPLPHHSVSQAFCSALPVSYSRIPTGAWTAFATMVLEGAYEATVWAAVINAQRTSSNVVYLTRLGGGAFGNDNAWIQSSMRRALDIVKDVGLDVRLVSFGPPSGDLVGLVDRYK
jgi:hypothetical protein